MLYFIITFISPVTVSLSVLCRLSLLALALPLKSICSPLYYCQIFTMSVLVTVFTLLCVNTLSSDRLVVDFLLFFSLLYGFFYFCLIRQCFFQSQCLQRLAALLGCLVRWFQIFCHFLICFSGLGVHDVVSGLGIVA